ncbi:MAG: IS66 family insertion sequence element accessory protein TnpB [Lachnospiraceae bacterium]|nr:IS66 family insertion sequence element accessory protein TnpB [Lachnospiraceae bacterium]
MLKRNVPIQKVIIIAGRTDMRKGINSLVAVVRLNYGLDPIEVGTLFLFCGLKKNTIKALVYEGDGFCLVTKRINSGSYRWPNAPNEARRLTLEEYDRLLDGFTIDSSIKQ